MLAWSYALSGITKQAGGSVGVSTKSHHTTHSQTKSSTWLRQTLGHGRQLKVPTKSNLWFTSYSQDRKDRFLYWFIAVSFSQCGLYNLAKLS